MGMYRLRRYGACEGKQVAGSAALKTQKALIANKKENAKVVKFAAPVAAPAMALAA